MRIQPKDSFLDAGAHGPKVNNAVSQPGQWSHGGLQPLPQSSASPFLTNRGYSSYCQPQQNQLPLLPAPPTVPAEDFFYPEHRSQNPPFYSEVAHRHTDGRNFQDPALVALTMEQESATRSSASCNSEKTNMLCGKPFNRIDPTLVADRLSCQGALSRFNNAGMANDPAELVSWEMLRQVVQPGSSHNSLHTDKPVGSLGSGVIVETPFQCEYGYNINIGDDVHIGRGCTIIDACTVIIGQKTTIGPKVTIIAGAPVDRKGVNSKWKGQPVIIEANVIIDAGACIYPGVRLGTNCTIEPGSVVKHDVLPGQRVGPQAAILYSAS
jgi:acetyltransferase-like isoleucine patch superfamily enzyme